MKLALPLVMAALAAGVGPAAAQQAALPWPDQEPPCMKEFVPLREDAAKKAGAIKAASERHATAVEACQLFKVFVAAEAKMVKYITENGARCGMPPDAPVQVKKNHEQSLHVRNQVCKAAAMGGAPGGPRAPSLSDALGATSVPDTRNVKPGRGTFDTLTGTPLGNVR